MYTQTLSMAVIISTKTKTCTQLLAGAGDFHGLSYVLHLKKSSPLCVHYAMLIPHVSVHYISDYFGLNKEVRTIFERKNAISIHTPKLYPRCDS
jgi:hypothetical protein